MTTAEETLPLRADARRSAFFGEPPALGYLAFTEAWERFSADFEPGPGSFGRCEDRADGR
jgi:hypothetical protein